MKKARKINIGSYILTFVLITLLALLTWSGYSWTLKTGLFGLEKIRITGNSIISESELHTIMGNLKQATLFDLNLVELSAKIEQHPYVAGARLSCRYPHQLSVEIMERKPIAMVNMDPLVLLDLEGIVLPMVPQAFEFQLPALSGFNPDQALYPIGEHVLSAKMKETVTILMEVHNHFPALYNELSEITLNQDDEYTLILTDHPTLINFGNSDVIKKIITLMAFYEALRGIKSLTDYAYLDLRYAKQIIVKEWS